MNSPFLSPEDVADLGMTLREAGYGVGPDRCIAAQRLIVTLALLAGVLAASLLAYQIHFELAMRTVRGTVVDYKGVPVPEAAVSFRGKQIQSDKDGSFPLAFR